MRTIELSTTTLKSYNLTLCDGKAVIRNQNRINGLIGVRNSLIPNKYHGLLAKATFVGNMVNESIIWTTDIFSGEPTPLSELNDELHSKYLGILNEGLKAYANAFKKAEDGVKDLLYAAITYSSEDAVYCADEKVVITEWGMSKKGDAKPIGMPVEIDDYSNEKDYSNNNEESLPVSNPNSDEDVENTKEPADPPTEESSKEPDSLDTLQPSKTPERQNDRGDVDNNSETGQNPALGNEPDTTESKPNVEDTSETNNTSENSNGGTGQSGGTGDKKKRWPWLLLLLLLAAAAILLSLLLRGCSSSSIEPTTPGIDSTQVVLSKDSLRYVANNRLLILLTKEGATIEAFEKSFRQHYRDDKKYILSNPDTVIKRLTLTLPVEERDKLEEKLPSEFADFGLVVIPETMYKGAYQSNDPDLGDSNKRWYFDECAIFDAWEVTMGSDNIVVAIIDDGFDLNHAELKGKVTKPYNAVYHSSNVTPSPSGHGTHVAATAVGHADNNTGIAGVAPKCKFMPIQVGDAQGNMATSAILDGVIYAINNGADVVNMSLGMAFGPFVQFAPLYIQKNFRANMFLQEERVWNHLFNIARQHNVTFVLAGGNENCLIGMDPMQRSPNTIKVSAVQPDKQKAFFSNYGDMSTVSAPGVRIYNAIPGDRYTFMDGTSMAAPIVTGGCALLKSKDTNLTVTELAQILRQTGVSSPSDVGPIVNFARALNAEPNDVDDCSKINERYQELLAELEKLKRENPGCIQSPDTLSIPEDASVDKLLGRWKSTTSLYNEQEEEVVIYFTFNGSSTARLDIVEPNGSIYSAGLAVSISNDQVFIDQTEPARSSVSGKGYNPYRFVLKPGSNRKAEGNAKNKVEIANIFNFNLIKI